MKTTPHTPGPWAIARSPKHGEPFITNATGKLTIANAINGTTPAEREANARLMSLAPDLLTALESMMLIIDTANPAWKEMGAVEQARAIIAQAKGEATP